MYKIRSVIITEPHNSTDGKRHIKANYLKDIESIPCVGRVKVYTLDEAQAKVFDTKKQAAQFATGDDEIIKVRS